MKRTMQLLTIIGYLTGASLNAVNCTTPPACYELPQNPHSIFIGPEVLGISINAHVHDIKVKGQRALYGIRFGYEYQKPNAFYVGIDFSSLGGGKSFHSYLNHLPLTQPSDNIWFGASEFRLGYTLNTAKAVYSPFLALGGYELENLFHNQGFKEHIPYGAAGLRSKWKLESGSTVGINLKVFHSINAYRKYKLPGIVNSQQPFSSWGGELGVPFTWFLGKCEKWNFQMEPYVLSLTAAEKQMVYGIDLLFGFHF